MKRLFRIGFAAMLIITKNVSVLYAQPNNNEIDQELWNKALKIANGIIIIDCHSHDLFKPVSSRFPKQVDISMIKSANVNGIVHSYPLDTRKKDNPKNHIINALNQFKSRTVSISVQIESSNGFVEIAEKEKLAVLLSLEYFHGMFEGNLETLQEYYDLGVRSICLSSRGKDTIYKVVGDNYQITTFGIGLIKKMNLLGVACDLSHFPEPMRQQIIEISFAPAYISHSNVRGVVDASFNLSDTTLHMLTSKGGVLCLTFYSEYVSEECFALKDSIKNIMDKPRARIEDFIDHIDYLKDHFGIDYICIGSDYGGSGRIAPKGLETIEGFPLIIYHMLKRSYTEEEIAKVMGLNYINYLKRVEEYSDK